MSVSSRRSSLSRPVRLILGIALVVVSGLVAFLVTVNRSSVSATGPPVPAPAGRRATPPSPTLSLDDIARAALSRTVTVKSLRASDEGLGTGWLLDTKGDFVTNAHVVARQETVRLRARDGSSHVGRVLAIDTSEDVAVVRSTDGFGGLTPLPVRVASVTTFPTAVVAIASSFATGHGDVTEETVGSLDPVVPVTGDTAISAPAVTTEYHDMLAFGGAEIFPGNSGGPLLDGEGEVVGIVTLASRSAAEGYAIPISRVLAELLADAAA